MFCSPRTNLPFQGLHPHHAFARWFPAMMCAIALVQPVRANEPAPPPEPLPSHPGNIFLAGEEVVVALPEDLKSLPAGWRAVDETGHTRITGTTSALNPISLGQAKIGWYRIEFLDDAGAPTHWTTCAVLAPRKVGPSTETPICLDSAVAWFARDDEEHQRTLANLAALAGVGWVRDRLAWRDMEPNPGLFSEPGNYDQAARIQAETGTSILQVFHDTPVWAAGPQRRSGAFPPDLRHAHHFCAAMGQRFLPYVSAWEPWNEANIGGFGGQTVDEMCSFQKAAFLGFKAASTDLTVGWNAYAAGPTQWHADGLSRNEVAAYFDTYNFHTYDWHDSYLDSWGPAFAAAGGKPVWITEADRGVAYETQEPWFDQSRSGERLKAEWMAQSYATSLFCGVEKHFHFILGHYKEENNGVQFGLLRKDFTPRPAYSALAALGRFLQDARCLGRWQPVEDENLHFYAFRARPDGQAHDVLVGWAERRVDWPERGQLEIEFQLPEQIEVLGRFDHMGREIRPIPPTRWRAPQFLLFAPGTLDSLELEPAPLFTPEEFHPSQVSPVVLQFIPDKGVRRKVEERPWTEGHAWTVPAETGLTGMLWVYNFGSVNTYGELKIENAPEGVTGRLDKTVAVVEPGERIGIPLTISSPNSDQTLGDLPAWLVIRGEFGTHGRPVVALGLCRPAPASK